MRSDQKDPWWQVITVCRSFCELRVTFRSSEHGYGYGYGNDADRIEFRYRRANVSPGYVALCEPHLGSRLCRPVART